MYDETCAAERRAYAAEEAAYLVQEEQREARREALADYLDTLTDKLAGVRRVNTKRRALYGELQ